jgi:hypothetical protein
MLFTPVKKGIMIQARARSSQAEIFSVMNLTAVSVNNKKELMPSSVSISAASAHFNRPDGSFPGIWDWVPVNNNGWLYR